jgi:hypothetical protein
MMRKIYFLIIFLGIISLHYFNEKYMFFPELVRDYIAFSTSQLRRIRTKNEYAPLGSCLPQAGAIHLNLASR